MAATLPSRPPSGWGWSTRRRSFQEESKDEDDGDEADADSAESRYFALDWSVRETFGADDRTAAWRELDEALSDVRAAGVCLCQFCAPGLDRSRFDRLSIVAAG
jgi:hypothetical protein